MMSALFVILFVASIALNAILLVGCETLTGPKGPIQRNPSGTPPSASPKTTSFESSYLRDIARKLGIDEPSGKTPGDIAFDIEQRLGQTVSYHDNILTDEAFSVAKAAILIPSDAEVFEAYHSFIQRVQGKKLIIVE